MLLATNITTGNSLRTHVLTETAERQLKASETSTEPNLVSQKNVAYKVTKDAEVGGTERLTDKADKASDRGEPVSPAEQILKKLREQIAQAKEKIAEVKAKIATAALSAKGKPAAQSDALRNQLNGLQGQLSALMGAYNDAVKEAQTSSQSGSLIDTFS